MQRADKSSLSLKRDRERPPLDRRDERDRRVIRGMILVQTNSHKRGWGTLWTLVIWTRELTVTFLRWDNGIVVLREHPSLTEAGGKMRACVSQLLQPTLKRPTALRGHRERTNTKGSLAVITGPRQGRSRGHYVILPYYSSIMKIFIIKKNPAVIHGSDFQEAQPSGEQAHTQKQEGRLGIHRGGHQALQAKAATWVFTARAPASTPPAHQLTFPFKWFVRSLLHPNPIILSFDLSD